MSIAKGRIASMGLLALMTSMLPGSNIFGKMKRRTPITGNDEIKSAAEAKRERRAQRNRELKLREGLR